MPEFYPMPSFVTLTVRDLGASNDWYRDVLGFEVVFSMPGAEGPSLVHLRWRRFADLLLRPGDPDDHAGGGVTISYATALDDLDRLAERARGAGAVMVTEPGDRPWNARDFTLADPDGYRLTFTAGPIDRGLGMDDVAARTAAA